jgi:hypothetical protein
MNKLPYAAFFILTLGSEYFLVSANAEELSEIFEVSGSIVVPFSSGQSESARFDSNNPYATLNLNLQPNDRIEFDVAIWGSTSIAPDFDEATATWHVLPESLLSITVGRQYVPFGLLNTEMVSDTLAEIISSTRSDKMLNISTLVNNFWSTGYIYRGNSGETKNTLGFSFGYVSDNGYLGFNYTSDFSESSEMSSYDIVNDVPGIAIYAGLEVGDFVLVTEVLKALEFIEFEDDDAEPQPLVAQVELNYLLGKDQTFAISWNDIQNVEGLEINNNYYGISYDRTIFGEFGIAIEIARFTDEDDDTESRLNLQLSYDF